MTVWEIYWLTRLEPMADAFSALSGFMLGLALLTGLATWFYLMYCDDTCEQPTKWRWFVGAVAGFLLLSAGMRFTVALLPSKSDLAVIFAASWATNSEEMRKLPDNVVGTLNRFMEQYAPAPAKAQQAEPSK